MSPLFTLHGHTRPNVRPPPRSHGCAESRAEGGSLGRGKSRRRRKGGGERLQTSKDGVGGGEGREGGERSDREKKKMQPPKIKSKDCIRSEQRCRNRWQLRVSEFASPFLIHELEWLEPWKGIVTPVEKSPFPGSRLHLYMLDASLHPPHSLSPLSPPLFLSPALIFFFLFSWLKQNKTKGPLDVCLLGGWARQTDKQTDPTVFGGGFLLPFCPAAAAWTCWLVIVYSRSYNLSTTPATSQLCHPWRRPGSRWMI